MNGLDLFLNNFMLDSGYIPEDFLDGLRKQFLIKYKKQIYRIDMEYNPSILDLKIVVYFKWSTFFGKSKILKKIESYTDQNMPNNIIIDNEVCGNTSHGDAKYNIKVIEYVK